MCRLTLQKKKLIDFQLLIFCTCHTFVSLAPFKLIHTHSHCILMESVDALVVFHSLKRALHTNCKMYLHKMKINRTTHETETLPINWQMDAAQPKKNSNSIICQVNLKLVNVRETERWAFTLHFVTTVSRVVCM